MKKIDKKYQEGTAMNGKLITLIVLSLLLGSCGSEVLESGISNEKGEDVSATIIQEEVISNSSENNEEGIDDTGYKTIKFGEASQIAGANGEGEFQVKLLDIEWKGKTITEGLNEYEAKNQFLAIKIEGENVGDTQSSISVDGVKLITRDRFEYGYEDVYNILEPREGYLGCIGCDINPGEKAESNIMFDINEIDLGGAILRFENYNTDFEL